MTCIALDKKANGKTHLGLDVIEGRRADDGEADKEDVGLGIG